MEKVMGKYNAASVATLNTSSYLGVDYAPPTPAPTREHIIGEEDEVDTAETVSSRSASGHTRKPLQSPAPRQPSEGSLRPPVNPPPVSKHPSSSQKPASGSGNASMAPPHPKTKSSPKPHQSSGSQSNSQQSKKRSEPAQKLSPLTLPSSGSKTGLSSQERIEDDKKLEDIFKEMKHETEPLSGIVTPQKRKKGVDDSNNILSSPPQKKRSQSDNIKTSTVPSVIKDSSSSESSESDSEVESDKEKEDACSMFALGSLMPIKSPQVVTPSPRHPTPSPQSVQSSLLPSVPSPSPGAKSGGPPLPTFQALPELLLKSSNQKSRKSSDKSGAGSEQRHKSKDLINDDSDSEPEPPVKLKSHHGRSLSSTPPKKPSSRKQPGSAQSTPKVRPTSTHSTPSKDRKRDTSMSPFGDPSSKYQQPKVKSSKIVPSSRSSTVSLSEDDDFPIPGIKVAEKEESNQIQNDKSPSVSVFTPSVSYQSSPKAEQENHKSLPNISNNDSGQRPSLLISIPLPRLGQSLDSLLNKFRSKNKKQILITSEDERGGSGRKRKSSKSPVKSESDQRQRPKRSSDSKHRKRNERTHLGQKESEKVSEPRKRRDNANDSEGDQFPKRLKTSPYQPDSIRSLKANQGSYFGPGQSQARFFIVQFCSRLRGHRR